MNLRKRKWRIISIYKPPKQNVRYFLEHLSSMLDFYGRKYEYCVVMGDFNLEPNNNHMKVFIEDLGLYNLVKTKTCFKSAQGSCIDLIITNKKFNFMHTGTYETGLSDFQCTQ